MRARSLSDAALGYPRGAMGGFLGFVFLHNTICHNRMRETFGVGTVNRQRSQPCGCAERAGRAAVSAARTRTSVAFPDRVSVWVSVSRQVEKSILVITHSGRRARALTSPPSSALGPAQAPSA